MNTCEACKWFDPTENPEYYLDDGTYVIREFGVCSNPIYFYDAGGNSKSWEEVKKEKKDKRFLYCDSDGYKAYFYVHMQFGCIGHKPKS